MKYLLQDFQILVLDSAVLTVARAQVADLLKFEEPNENRAFRFQAYRQFTLWAHGKLGRRAAKIIPACCTVAIRKKYPDPEGKYKVFFATKDNY